MIDISTIEILANAKNFPGSRHKFPRKREILKPLISREIFRPDIPGGNTSDRIFFFSVTLIERNLQLLYFS